MRIQRVLVPLLTVASFGFAGVFAGGCGGGKAEVKLQADTPPAAAAPGELHGRGSASAPNAPRRRHRRLPAPPEGRAARRSR